MHLISIRNLRAEITLYRHNLETQINAWYATVKNAEWKNLEDIRRIYRDAEAVGNFTVFNIKGNSYRVSRIDEVHLRSPAHPPCDPRTVPLFKGDAIVRKFYCPGDFEMAPPFLRGAGGDRRTVLH